MEGCPEIPEKSAIWRGAFHIQTGALGEEQCGDRASIIMHTGVTRCNKHLLLSDQPTVHPRIRRLSRVRI